jgi:hypothetical protein
VQARIPATAPALRRASATGGNVKRIDRSARSGRVMTSSMPFNYKALFACICGRARVLH